MRRQRSKGRQADRVADGKRLTLFTARLDRFVRNIARTPRFPETAFRKRSVRPRIGPHVLDWTVCRLGVTPVGDGPHEPDYCTQIAYDHYPRKATPPGHHPNLLGCTATHRTQTGLKSPTETILPRPARPVRQTRRAERRRPRRDRARGGRAAGCRPAAAARGRRRRHAKGYRCRRRDRARVGSRRRVPARLSSRGRTRVTQGLSVPAGQILDVLAIARARPGPGGPARARAGSRAAPGSPANGRGARARIRSDPGHAAAGRNPRGPGPARFRPGSPPARARLRSK